MSTIARLAVKVDRISEKLHRKASKLGNRETVKLHQSRGATTVKELILKEAENVPPGEVRPVTVFIENNIKQYIFCKIIREDSKSFTEDKKVWRI